MTPRLVINFFSIFDNLVSTNDTRAIIYAVRIFRIEL